MTSVWSAGIGTNAGASALGRLTELIGGGDDPPAFLIPIYKAAARRYHVRWQILAAINAIETDYGRNLSVSSAGAIGWMQFMPATWRHYAVAARGHGQPNPYDPRDASFSAARYLAAHGAARNLRTGIFAYNHDNSYVNEVIWLARTISDRKAATSKRAATRCPSTPGTCTSSGASTTAWISKQRRTAPPCTR